jgi:hypothetical protein
VEIASPQELSITGRLQLALYRDRSDQVQPQPDEGRILRRELGHGPDRPPLKIPNVHAQHSPLT